jgi:hypothetical protein
MKTYNDRLDSAALRQPLPSLPDREGAKKFEAAKNSADRSKEDNVPNGGSFFRGPLEGGATADPPSGGDDRRPSVVGGGIFFGGEWDFGSKGVEVRRFKGGVTLHSDPDKKEGYGIGMKDGGLGVAKDNADGGSVTTPGDVKGDGKSGGKPGVPEGLDWSKDLKRAIPPAAPKDINDLGPPTNEPEQKKDDTAVA